jgi:hypothetical protein
MKLVDHSREYYLKIQPFASQGIYLKRRGDRYILAGKTKAYADKLERKGFRFDAGIRAWLMPPRPANVYVYAIVGDALGIDVDMRKYAHLVGRQRSRKLGAMRYDRSVEINYAENLTGLLSEIKVQVHGKVIPILERFKTQFEIGGNAGAQYLQEALRELAQIRSQHDFERIAKNIASHVMAKADSVNRTRYAKRIEEATGMNVLGQI